MSEPILIVDNSASDSELLLSFLRKKGVANFIQILPDGVAAIDYLSGQQPYSDRLLHPFPSLVFLELAMPKKDGYEVLEWLNAHPEILPPKVVLYTKAIGIQELERCYRLGANAFFLKQTMEEQFRDLLSRFPEVWEFADPGKR
jgi:CheY-like chemotaxis protein